MTRNFKLGIVGIACFITLYMLVNVYHKRTLKKHFYFFDSAKLCGRISSIEYREKMQVISLNNSDSKYYFYPYSSINSGKSVFFEDIAQLNDSVFKPAFSDTLLLTKSKSEIYKFIFYQPD